MWSYSFTEFCKNVTFLRAASIFSNASLAKQNIFQNTTSLFINSTNVSHPSLGVCYSLESWRWFCHGWTEVAAGLMMSHDKLPFPWKNKKKKSWSKKKKSGWNQFHGLNGGINGQHVDLFFRMARLCVSRFPVLPSPASTRPSSTDSAAPCASVSPQHLIGRLDGKVCKLVE